MRKLLIAVIAALAFTTTANAEPIPFVGRELLRGYCFDYIYVRACHGITKDYLVKWITDGELERSRKDIAKIEQIALSQSSVEFPIDTTKLWKEAEGKRPDMYFEGECREHYNYLRLALPKSPAQKDFGN
jgi:hypothetical protein